MSAILVYDSRKSIICIKISRYSVIKANVACYRSKIIVENLTNLTGIIDDSVPFLNNYLISVETRIIWDKGFDRFPKGLIFGTTFTSFSKICRFRLFINCSCQISLPSVGVPFYLSLFISVIQHIFLVNSTSIAGFSLSLSVKMALEFIVWYVFTILVWWELIRHIEARTCVNWIIIGAGNVLLPVRCQAITWTNAVLLSLENKFPWGFNQTTSIFIQENEVENVICKLSAIFLLCFNRLIPVFHLSAAGAPDTATEIG